MRALTIAVVLLIAGFGATLGAPQHFAGAASASANKPMAGKPDQDGESQSAPCHSRCLDEGLRREICFETRPGQCNECVVKDDTSCPIRR